MDQHRSQPDAAIQPNPTEGREPQGLAAIPASEFLRNLANQTIIQSQRVDLAKEIRESPGDNALRLKYAEHLENFPLSTRDRARAELIRLQIARKDSPPTDREREILLRHEREWMRELGHVRGVRWDRGFITGVTMSPRHFAESRETLSREPITHLHIPTLGGSEEGGSDLKAAVRAPHFAAIERLSFWIGSPRALAYIEDLLGAPDTTLREIHFQSFVGSHQELLEACERIHYPTQPSSTSNLDLALGDISITFGSMR